MTTPRRARQIHAQGPSQRSPDGIDDLLGRIRYFLGFQSKRPLEDASEIDELIGEIRMAYSRSEEKPQGPGKELSQMLEETREDKPVLMVDDRAPSPELDKLLHAVVDDPETWLSTPSVQFGGRRPCDLVGTDEEFKIFDLLYAVEQGLF
jgi:hypothetical protein